MFGVFKKKLMPARSKFSDSSNVVADLDAILVRPVAFILHGKEHVINPLSVEQFLFISKNIAEIYHMQDQKEITADELIDKYYHLMKGACGTIKRSDISEMTQGQIAALFELLIETVTGKIFAEKKTPKIQPVEQASV